MGKASQSRAVLAALGVPTERGPCPCYNASLAVTHNRSLVSCTFPVLGSQGTGIFQLKSVRPGDDALLPVLFQFLQPSTLAAGRSLRRQERDTKNKSFINKIHKPVLQH